MDPLREEDEEADALRRSIRLVSALNEAHASRGALSVYPASVKSRSSSPAPSERGGAGGGGPKPAPPRPILKSGDDTAAGAAQPVVDEIAGALREWHARMFTYLAQRDYARFAAVRAHADALHLARRQLLAQTLSAEETAALRRDCVARLARGNIAQGLDVIVRHPVWGALVTVDADADAADARSWVSAVRMYAMQISLAYLDGAPRAGPQPAGSKTSLDHAHGGPVPTPANSSFPELILPRSARAGGAGFAPGVAAAATAPSRHKHAPSTLMGAALPAPAPAAKFYHIFLDVRALVASLCAPGERAELFFALYNRTDARFVTEEFCAVLDHHGVPARGAGARVRTLFTDLVLSDVQEPLYLVCRIVRNGALRLGADMSSGMPAENGRRGSEGSLRDGASGGTNGTVSRSQGAVDGVPQFRRPFGVAVLELTQLPELLAEGAEMTATKEFSMPIFVPTNESMFSMSHQDVIASNIKEYEKSPR
jgi:dedicator of cytokinesis protein 3